MRSRAQTKVVAKANAMTAKQIEAAAIKLPKRDRERIVGLLIDSLRSKRELEILKLWEVEIERRTRDFEAGIHKELPLERESRAIKLERRMQDALSGEINGISAEDSVQEASRVASPLSVLLFCHPERGCRVGGPPRSDLPARASLMVGNAKPVSIKRSDRSAIPGGSHCRREPAENPREAEPAEAPAAIIESASLELSRSISQPESIG